MKKGNIKKIVSVLGIFLFTIFISTGCSCTSSMCSDGDIENIKTEIERKNIEQWRNKAALGGMKVESDEYKVYADAKVEELYLLDPCASSGTCSADEIATIKSNIRSNNNNKWLNELEELNEGNPGYINTRTNDFNDYVNEEVDKLYESHPKACLTIKDDTDPETGAKLEAKSWGDAWSTGLLEGLIVYPISWLLAVLTESFGANGAGQLLAIIIAVIIIRIFMLLINFKGQLSTIKMQSIQGEVSKISEKLRDPNLTQSEKQALSIKMMDIYKKNNINPLSSMLTQFISFPIFIAVWAAMNQTVAIRRGTLLGMEFGTAINSQIFDGNIAAIILFILMILGQLSTMKVPTLLRERKEKKKNPHYVKRQKTDSEKQMNMMMIFMLILVVMSGFVLPVALVIYWFVGSLFSLAQTFVFNTDYITAKLNTLANRKKKAKVVK